MSLEPGEISYDESGRGISARFRAPFAGSPNPWHEAHSIFVAGAALREHWSGATQFAVLELGFGLGLNFLTTLAAWREDPDRPVHLDYVAIEAHPLPAAALGDALERHGAPVPDRQHLCAQWPLPCPGLHRLTFEQGRVSLTLALGDVHTVLPRLGMAADAFFADGFAPALNPAMWTPALFRQLARRARPGARLAARHANPELRANLFDAGFACDDLRAPVRGDRTLATYRPRWRGPPPPPASPQWPERTVLVVGAGIAGAAVAEGFATRGWQVQVVERGPAPLAGGSAQTRLGTHIHCSPDDNHLARLTRAALGLHPGALAEDGAGDCLGKLVLAHDDMQIDAQTRLLERWAPPPAFARWLERDSASAVAGAALPRGALWLPRAIAYDPALRVAQALMHARIDCRFDAEIASITPAHERWIAHTARGERLGPFALLVLCNAGDALRLGKWRSLHLRRMRGQTTRARIDGLEGLRVMLGGDAYACPLPGGQLLVGATFDPRETLDTDPGDDRSNLRRLARMLDRSQSWSAQGVGATTGYRWSAHDRMPLLGWAPHEQRAGAERDALVRNAKLALPREPALMLACGFGARGALWAQLAGALLPALADGHALPLEADLVRAVDPARFLRRALAKGTLH